MQIPQLQKLLIILLTIIVLNGCNKEIEDIPLEKEQKDISKINIDEVLRNFDKKDKDILCKELVNKKEEYLECVKEAVKNKPTIKNLEYLAGLYVVKREFQNAIKVYEEAIKKGSKKATYSLAGLYNEQTKQREKAKKLFMSIKEYKDSTCQIGGILALKDNDDAFDFYEDQIKKGNNKAYICQGLLHVKERNYYEAKDSYEKLLSLGDKEAYFYLGNLYSAYLLKHGRAIDSYTKAAKELEDGNERKVLSMLNLGAEYASYNRYDDAVYWLVQALKAKKIEFPIEYKEVNPLESLVYLYRKTNNEENMIKVLKKLQELGESGGYSDLAIYYKKHKNYKKAEEIFRECINKGFGDCAAGLGTMYYDLGDKDKTKESYMIGVSMGNSYSMRGLALYYKLMEKDYKKSIFWFKKATKLGDEIAARNLAWLYEKELKDEEKAKIWFKKAYDLGDKSLEKKLKKLGVL
ncbi:tetratricopeptide repeat protein [Halarcobacter ebronensis]|uniref:beta-lactamase n=1 Tax=Halarcobacter ebronensis TaxID=1462615 RepID=A0A4Q1AR83_9BACT|nr:tetratricopeptide repeat protein [Halarcobacter ebronensis]QKF82331.1 Sel1 domain-containing protein [Halarcobacter ebronensis]RXK07639.1 hypothetical protein CRV07_04035 [Halarcobacter ebronensis]